MTHRDPIRVTLLSCLTFGIYWFCYIVPSYMRDIAALTREKTFSLRAAVMVASIGVLVPILLVVVGYATDWGAAEWVGRLMVGMPSIVFASWCAFRLEATGQRETTAVGRSPAWIFLWMVAAFYATRLAPGAFWTACNVGAFACGVYILQREFNRHATCPGQLHAPGQGVTAPDDCVGHPAAGEGMAQSDDAGTGRRAHVPRAASGRRSGSPGWGLALGIVALLAWLIPLLGLPIAVVGLVLSAKALRRHRNGVAIAGTVVGGIAVALCLINAAMGVLMMGRRAASPEGGAPVVGSVEAGGLQRNQLPLTAAKLTVYWKEWDVVFSDPFAMEGSATVLGADGGELVLITNRHCLGLKELREADGGGYPEVGDYRLTVKFPSGVELPVKRFMVQADGVDVAVLVVDSGSLRRGTDYVELAIDEAVELEQGAEVVAVGVPLGLEGTMTFGRISAVREQRQGEISFRLIQTDAPINHGNSGGPLFLRRGDRYVCIGFNTAKMEDAGAEGLGFAIAAPILRSNRFSGWCDATASGVQRLFDR